MSGAFLKGAVLERSSPPEPPSSLPSVRPSFGAGTHRQRRRRDNWLPRRLEPLDWRREVAELSDYWLNFSIWGSSLWKCSGPVLFSAGAPSSSSLGADGKKDLSMGCDSRQTSQLQIPPECWCTEVFRWWEEPLKEPVADQSETCWQLFLQAGNDSVSAGSRWRSQKENPNCSFS